MQARLLVYKGISVNGGGGESVKVGHTVEYVKKIKSRITRNPGL